MLASPWQDILEDRMNPLAPVEAIDLFTQELELCKVHDGEAVVVLAEPGSKPDYVAAAFTAAKRLGAEVMQVTLPGGSPTQLPNVLTGSGYGLAALETNALALKLLQDSDMVVDLTLEGLIHSPVQAEILSGGTRVLYVCEPLEVLARNMPVPEDKARARAAQKLINESTTMHVTSPAGTDLTVGVENSAPMIQCGFTDEPGRWDHWPSGLMCCWPASEGVNGTVVMQPGDILFPFKEYVQHTIEFEIEQGVITNVTGGAEAVRLNQFFEDANDEEARYTSHMGWGLMRTADWSVLGQYNKESVMGMDARCLPGNFLFSTGPHPIYKRTTPYHLDLPIRGVTITLDGQTVVEDERLVLADQA
jgi:2,5-dihydroxypyridine 5,6-dioxygenase